MAENKHSRSQQYAQDFADEIVKAIQDGRAPWQKEWKPGPIKAPFNPSSGTEYKGANHVGLIFKGGYDDPRWMTFKQATEQGFHVKKGERAQKISFYSPFRNETVLDDQGKPVLQADGTPEKALVNKPVFKVASVFNASQIEGIQEYAPEPASWDPVERAEVILANSGADITHSQRDRAFYRPATDRIELPPKSQFATPESYYATAIHELAHWTKQPGRVERSSGPKGTEEYAKEELRAEIASWMINTQLGLGHDPSNHLAYTAGWAKAIEDDPKEIFRACRDAEKIKEFIMGLEHEKAVDKDSAQHAEQLVEQKVDQQAAQQTEQPVSISPERAQELMRTTWTSSLEKEATPEENKLIREIWDKLPGDTSRETVLNGIYQRRISPEGELLPPGQINGPRAQWLLDLNDEARSPEHWWHYVPKEEQQTLQNPEAGLRTLQEIVSKGLTHEKAEENTSKTEQAPEAAQTQQPQIATEKTWLAVPYRQRYQVKPHGAKWDPENKSWYAPEGTDLTPLKAFLPEQNQQPIPQHVASPQEEFARALQDAGLDLQGNPPEMDGELHRVPVSGGKPGNKDGAYVGHLDDLTPAGFIQNHREGTQQNWRYTGHALSDEERARLQAEAARRKAEREKEREERHAEAANKARYIYGLANPANGMSHPYLHKKQIFASEDLRISSTGDLVIPARNAEGELRTLQFISPDGEKRFLSGGQKSGSFLLIGKDRSETNHLLLAEGYATAATINQAMRMPVAVCFDAGNIEAVAKALHEKYPDKEIVICADNDAAKNNNVGVEKAKAAAAAVGGKVIIPIFNGAGKGTDFNDLATTSGLSAVTNQILGGLRREKEADTGLEM